MILFVLAILKNWLAVRRRKLLDREPLQNIGMQPMRFERGRYRDSDAIRRTLTDQVCQKPRRRSLSGVPAR